MNVADSSNSLKEQIVNALRPLLPTHVLSRLLPTALATNPLFNKPSKVPRTLTPAEYEEGVLTLRKLLEGGWNFRSNNKHGVVFTPKEATTHLVQLLGLPAPNALPAPLRIFDPAVGSGTLLLECLEQLSQREEFRTPESLTALLRNSIFGVDRDPFALITTRASILLWLHKIFPDAADFHIQNMGQWERNFWCGDFLSKRALDFDQTLLSLRWEDLLREHSSFTHIIGNPPYGLSRDEQIAPHTLQHYKEVFGKSLPGKPNKYILFLFRSLELLEEGGQLSFLIPNAWLGISSGKGMREFLLQNGYIRTIDIVEEKTFIKRGVETVFLQVKKEYSKTFTLNHKRNSLSSHPGHSVVFDVADLMKDTPDATIPLYRTPLTGKIWKRIQGSSTPLHETSLPLAPRIALQAYRLGGGTPPQTKEVVQTHPFHERTPSTSFSHRYLQGRDVKPWKIDWSGDFLKYGPWLAEHQPFHFYSTPRLIFREVLGRAPNLFIGTYTDEVFFYNRSLLHIVGKEREETVELSSILKALLLLILSPVGTFYLIARGRKAARRLFPKIVLDDLKEFPIPRGFENEVPWLEKEADLHLSGGEREATLNEKIATLYGVELSEVQKVIRG